MILVVLVYSNHKGNTLIPAELNHKTATYLKKPQPISLAEVSVVALMKRVDTKFIMNVDDLPQLIDSIANDYQVLEIDGNRLMTYDSTYFDTPRAFFYHSHHNGHAHRIKIRIRNYVESELSFLEVKQKDSQGNTIKSRIKLDSPDAPLEGELLDFIKKTTSENFVLNKALNNSFNRFTLVQKELKERITIDLNLGYNGHILNPKLAIIELKQEKLRRSSPIFQALKKMGVHPYKISKYCIGMASLMPKLKQNFFKAKFLKINKLTA